MNHYIVCCQRRLKKYSATLPSLQKQQKIRSDVTSKKEIATTYFAFDRTHSQSGDGVKITREMTIIKDVIRLMK